VAGVADVDIITLDCAPPGARRAKALPTEARPAPAIARVAASLMSIELPKQAREWSAQ
jgi:hypothetical protein